MSKITVYFTSVTASAETKKHQKRISDILGETGYRGCEVEYVDIAADTKSKEKMREIVGDSKALPPQITKGDVYLGDYKAFDNAVENEDIKGFLQIS